MAESTIGPRIQISGEQEFKAAMASINNEFKMLGSEMKLAVSGFDKADKSTAALTAQNKVLGKEIDSQKGKIALLTTQYDKQNSALVTLKTKLDATKAAFGADSAEVAKAQKEYDKQNNTVRNLQTELNKAATGLNNMDRELKENNEGLKNQGNNANKASKELGNLDDKTSKLHSSMKVLGSGLKLAAVGIAAAGAAFAGMAVASVKDAAEAEASVSQLDAAIKSTGGAAGVTRKELTDMADALEKTTKFSAESTQAADALLLTFTNIGKDIFPQTTKIALDMAQALGTDASGGAIQLGKALNDPIAGISALSRVGVSFSEDQKAVIKKLQETGDMAGAQKIILAELNKEFGGSAEAAGKTFAGQLEIAKNALGNVKETIGTALLPKLTEFLNWVTPNLPAIADFFTKAFDSIGKFITNNLIPAFTSFLEWIKPHIPSIKEIISVAFDTIKIIFKGISDFVTTYVIPAFKFLKEKFDEYFPAIKNAVMQVYDYLKPHFDKLVATIKEDLMPIIMGLWDTVQKAMPGIKAIFEIAMPIIVGAIGLVIDGIGVFIKVVKGIYDFIKPGLDLVANIFSTVFTGIQRLIEGVQWVLNKFNNTPMKDKSATVTTNYKDLGPNGPLTTSHTATNASGTDNFRGGLTTMHEKGYEVYNLPGGSKIYNHEASQDMVLKTAQEVARSVMGGMQSGGISQTLHIYSPTPLTPSEIARQSRNAMRELALNF